MSSESSYPRCTLELRRSRTLSLMFLVLACLAFLAPWLASLSVPIGLCANLAVLGLGLREMRAPCLAQVTWFAEGHWRIEDDANCVHEDARLQPGILVLPQVVLLHWRCPACDAHLRLVALHDNAQPGALRLLRARLNTTSDRELFRAQRDGQRTGASLLAKLSGTSTVSRGGCCSSRSG